MAFIIVSGVSLTIDGWKLDNDLNLSNITILQIDRKLWEVSSLHDRL